MVGTPSCQQLKKEARQWDRAHPEDLEERLARWEAVLRVCPEDAEAQERIRHLREKLAFRERQQQARHLYETARRHYEQGGEEDVLALRKIRDQLHELLRKGSGRETANYLEEVRTWYQELSDKFGRPTTLLAQKKYKEALDEIVRLMQEGATQIYDPEQGTYVPIEKAYTRTVEAYVTALPGLLERWQQDVAEWIERNPVKAEETLKRIEAWIQHKGLPPKKREALEEQYRPSLEAYKRKIEEARRRYEKALQKVEEARQTQDPVHKWTLLQEARVFFEALEGLQIELEITKQLLEVYLREKARETKRKLTRLLQARDFEQARRVLATFEKKFLGIPALPEDLRDELVRLSDAQFQKVTDEEENFRQFETLLGEAKTLVEKGQYRQALALLQAIPSAYQRESEVLRLKWQAEQAGKARAQWQGFYQAYAQEQWDEAWKALMELREMEQDESSRKELETYEKRLTAVRFFERAREKEKQGQWEEAARAYRQALERFRQAGGPDDVTQEVFEQTEKGLNRVQQLQSLQQEVRSFLKEKDLPLRSLEDIRQWMERWQQGRALLEHLAEDMQEYEQLKSSLNRLQQEGSRYLRGRVKTAQSAEDLKTLMELWERAWDIGFLPQDEETYAQYEAIERKWLKSQIAQLQGQIPASCSELRRLLLRRNELATSREERERFEDETHAMLQECLLRRLESAIEAKTPAPELLQDLEKALKEWQIRPDPALVGQLLLRLIDGQRWDVLARMNEIPPRWLPYGIWHDLLQRLVEWHRTVESESPSFSRQDLERTKEAWKQAVRAEPLRDLLEQMVRHAHRLWLNLLRERIREAMEQNDEDTLWQRLGAYLQLADSQDIQTLPAHRRIATLLRDRLHEEQEHWLQDIVQALDREDWKTWTRVRAQKERLEGLWELSKHLPIAREREFRELQQKAEKLLDIFAKMDAFMHDLRNLRSTSTSLEEVLRHIEKMHDDATKILNQSVEFPELYRALEQLSQRLEDQKAQLQTMQKQLQDWRKALQEEKFQEAETLMQEIQNRWLHLPVEYRIPEMHYRYVYLNFKGTTPEKHLEALRKIRENLARWEEHLQNLENTQRKLREFLARYYPDEQAEWDLVPKPKWDVLVADLGNVPLRKVVEHIRSLLEGVKELTRQDLPAPASRRARQLKKRREEIIQELQEPKKRLERMLQEGEQREKQAEECYDKLRERLQRAERAWSSARRGWRKRRVSPRVAKDLQKIVEECRELDPYRDTDLLHRAEQMASQILKQS